MFRAVWQVHENNLFCQVREIHLKLLEYALFDVLLEVRVVLTAFCPPRSETPHRAKCPIFPIADVRMSCKRPNRASATGQQRTIACSKQTDIRQTTCGDECCAITKYQLMPYSTGYRRCGCVDWYEALCE